MTPEAFFNKYSIYAKNASKKGIYPAVALAIAYLESNRPGAGISALASKYNNFHGIQKYPKFTGQTVRLTDNLTGSSRYFCTYPNIQAGFDGFINFLRDNPRYEKAGVFTARTPEEQVKRIGAAGYSETGTWATSVLNFIDKYYPAAAKTGSILLGIGILGLVIYFSSQSSKSKNHVYL
jgi:flagellum-specific peptidoglycan hydrolase FlgJ